MRRGRQRAALHVALCMRRLLPPHQPTAKPIDDFSDRPRSRYQGLSPGPHLTGYWRDAYPAGAGDAPVLSVLKLLSNLVRGGVSVGSCLRQLLKGEACKTCKGVGPPIQWRPHSTDQRMVQPHLSHTRLDAIVLFRGRERVGARLQGMRHDSSATDPVAGPPPPPAISKIRATALPPAGPPGQPGSKLSLEPSGSPCPLGRRSAAKWLPDD